MKKKRNMKQIIFIIFLALAITSVFGKMLGGISENSLTDNQNIIGNGEYDNSSYNGSISNLSNPNYEVEGICSNVVDGDTIDIDGIGRIRLVGIDTPERGEDGYYEATEYVKDKCLGKKVYLDIDDAENRDKYGRILAIVYVDDLNINQQLLKLDYAKVLYIPPSEFEKGLSIK